MFLYVLIVFLLEKTAIALPGNVYFVSFCVLFMFCAWLCVTSLRWLAAYVFLCVFVVFLLGETTIELPGRVEVVFFLCFRSRVPPFVAFFDDGDRWHVFLIICA